MQIRPIGFSAAGKPHFIKFDTHANQNNVAARGSVNIGDVIKNNETNESFLVTKREGSNFRGYRIDSEDKDLLPDIAAGKMTFDTFIRVQVKD